MATRHIKFVHRVEQAAQRGQEFLVRQQSKEGSFDLGFDGGALPDAHFVLIERILDLGAEDISERLLRRLLDRQLPEGGWPLAPGMRGHLSTTVEAYLALRASGIEASEPALRRAKRFILSQGGLGDVRGPSRVSLALLGLLPWAELNIPLAEVALLPALAPVSLFKVGAPLRLHVLPLLVLRALEAVPALRLGRAVGAELGVASLVSEGSSPVRPGSLRDDAITACLRLMRERLDEDGTLGGLLMSTGWAAVAARVIGLDAEDPLTKLPPRGLRSLVYQSNGRDVHVRVCCPTVRSSAVALCALRRLGSDQGDAIEKLRDFLVEQRADEHGDFEILGPSGPVTAWSIKPRSRRFPSLIDTAAVVAALSGLPETRRLEAMALRWIRSMQRPDGGFALFDRHSATAPWLSRLPLGLLVHTLNDESSPEVTGRVLEVACSRGALDVQQIQRAVSFLIKRQRSDGSWQGPFSLGYIPTTSAALAGLASARRLGSDAVRRGVSFLLQQQRLDGGWGESPDSVAQQRSVDLGRSVPTQTALALQGLLEGGSSLTGAAVEKALWHLLWTQEPDGSWVEDDPCAASLAEVVHLRDPVEAIARPVIALSVYLDRAKGESKERIRTSCAVSL